MKKPTLFSYHYKNILGLLLIAVVPALFMALLQPQYLVSDFFVHFAMNIDSFTVENFFGDVFRYFSVINFESAWAFLLWMISMLLLLSVLGFNYSTIERNMRLGVDFEFRLPSLVNDSIMMILPYALIIIGSLELLGLLISGLIAFFIAVFGSGWVLFGISLFLCIIVYGAFIVFFALLSMCVPSSLIDGYSFNFAAGSSINLAKGSLKSITVSLFMPFGISYLVLTVASTLLEMFAPDVRLAVVRVIWFLFYTFWMIYLPLVTTKHYMQLSGMDG